MRAPSVSHSTVAPFVVHECIAGQGYVSSQIDVTRAANVQSIQQTPLQLIKSRYKDKKELNKLVKRSAMACSQKSGTLCGSGGTGSALQDKMALLVVMSPSAFDARTDPIGPARAFAVSPPKQQHSCYTCSAFAVAAAAESAVAAGAGVNGSAIDLSEQQLHYCSTDPATSDGQMILCTSGRSVKNILKALWRQKEQPLLSEQCMQYDGNVDAESDSICTAKSASGSCKAPHYVAEGNFKWSDVSSPAAAQQYIRERGGVISRFDIYE